MAATGAGDVFLVISVHLLSFVNHNNQCKIFIYRSKRRV